MNIDLDVGGAAKGWPQESFCFDREHFNVAYLGGVGCGKTLTLLIDAFDYAYNYPGSRQIITEPSYLMITDTVIPTIMDNWGEQEGVSFTMNRSAPIDVKIPIGKKVSEIWLRSTETGQRLYGPNVARVLMDEITLGSQQEQHGILAQRCRQADFPHQVKVAGTPKGRSWIYNMFVKEPKADTVCWQVETADNLHLPKGYVQRLVDLYGGWDTPRARQELGGQWLQLVGPVFPQFSRAIHIRELGQDAWGTMRQRFGGIDFGASSPTALVIAGLDSSGKVWVVAEWYKHQATLDNLVEAMGRLGHEWGITRWVCDPSGKQQMEFLQRQGLTVMPASHGNKIELRVQLFGARLNVGPSGPGLYVSSSCPNLITETETLAWQRVKLSGQMEEIMSDSFERGAPDHAVDAITNVLSAFDKPMTWELPKAQFRMQV